MPELAIMESLYETWDVSEEGFPTNGTPAEKLRFLLRYAILAPSGHNSQPWIFRVGADCVDLYADRRRALPVVDPADRELVISCGAALLFLRIAARHFGYTDEVCYFPDPQNQDLLATLRLGQAHKATPVEDQIFYAILKRRTNRLPFKHEPVEAHLLGALHAEALEEGAELRIIDDDAERYDLAGLICVGDRVQWSNASFRRELAAWLHPNRTLTGDGIPGYAVGYSDVASLTAPLVVRTFDLGNGVAAKDSQLATESPALVMLWTRNDTERDWLATGQALARVLLRATAGGVSASFLNQPVEVPELRPKMRDLLHIKGYPQLLLRMGYGPEARLTPRRPLEEVIA